MHLPKTPETVGLIGDDALNLVKPTVRIINAARGGIVDEEALATALKEGRVAGAGIDVYAKEPCTDSPLFDFENVVVTPHLGASTDEAQEKAGIAVARSVRLALAGELVPDAVNVQGGVIAEEVRPGLAAGREARPHLHRPRRRGARPDRRRGPGEIAQYDVSVLELAALKGVFQDVVEESVSYVNAPLLAEERGVEVRLLTEPSSPDFRNVVTLRGTLADGSVVTCRGHPDRAAQGGEGRRDRRLRPRGADRRAHGLLPLRRPPGRRRHGGPLLGEADINIAGMQVVRDRQGGQALVVLTVDTAIPPACSPTSGPRSAPATSGWSTSRRPEPHRSTRGPRRRAGALSRVPVGGTRRLSSRDTGST